MSPYPIEIFDDPLGYLRYRAGGDTVSMNIRRTIPDEVPVGRFEGIRQVVDALVPRAEYLDRIQQVCAALGERFELRFFDHSVDDGFDAAVLDGLDEIRALAIDSLADARNLAAVGRLPNLTHLRYGPAFAEGAGVLATMGVARLASFTLAGSPSPTLDLAPLGGSTSLRTLRLLGRGRNTAAIGAIASLTELAMHPSPKEPLDFVGRLPRLEVLKLVLGKKESIAEIGPLPALRDLSCFQVGMLADLGDLQRFPRLRRLQLSDMKHIAEIATGPGNAELEHVRLYAVPSLRAIHGLAALPALKSLYAYDSRLSPPWASLPPTLTHFELATKAAKGRDAHEAEVRAHGLIPGGHPDAEFFYK